MPSRWRSRRRRLVARASREARRPDGWRPRSGHLAPSAVPPGGGVRIARCLRPRLPVDVVAHPAVVRRRARPGGRRPQHRGWHDRPRASPADLPRHDRDRGRGDRARPMVGGHRRGGRERRRSVLPRACRHPVRARQRGRRAGLGLRRPLLRHGRERDPVLPAERRRRPRHVRRRGADRGPRLRRGDGALVGRPHRAFATAGQDLFAAAFASSTIVSLADKIISGFVALAILDALPAELSRHPLARPDVAGPAHRGDRGGRRRGALVATYIALTPAAPAAPA